MTWTMKALTFLVIWTRKFYAAWGKQAVSSLHGSEDIVY